MAEAGDGNARKVAQKNAEARKKASVSRKKLLSKLRFTQVFLGTNSLDTEIEDIIGDEMVSYVYPNADRDQPDHVAKVKLGDVLKIVAAEAALNNGETDSAVVEKVRELLSQGRDAPVSDDQIKQAAQHLHEYAGREIRMADRLVAQQEKRREQHNDILVARGDEAATQTYLEGLSEEKKLKLAMRLAKAETNADKNAERGARRWEQRQRFYAGRTGLKKNEISASLVEADHAVDNLSAGAAGGGEGAGPATAAGIERRAAAMRSRAAADMTAGQALGSESEQRSYLAVRRRHEAVAAYKKLKARQRVIGTEAAMRIARRQPGHFLNGLKYAALSVAERVGVNTTPKPTKKKPGPAAPSPMG